MSTIDDLMKLKELLNSGLITEEEFMQQKKRILKEGVEVKEINNYNNVSSVIESNNDFETTKTFLNNSNSNINSGKKKKNGCLIAAVVYLVFMCVTVAIVFSIGISVGNVKLKLFENYQI